jgi:hypothetical protein
MGRSRIPNEARRCVGKSHLNRHAYLLSTDSSCVNQYIAVLLQYGKCDCVGITSADTASVIKGIIHSHCALRSRGDLSKMSSNNCKHQ